MPAYRRRRHHLEAVPCRPRCPARRIRRWCFPAARQRLLARDRPSADRVAEHALDGVFQRGLVIHRLDIGRLDAVRTSAKVRSSSSGSGALELGTAAASPEAAGAQAPPCMPSRMARASVEGRAKRRRCNMSNSVMRGHARWTGWLGGAGCRHRSALRAAPMGRVAGATVLTNGEIQCGGFLAAAGATVAIGSPALTMSPASAAGSGCVRKAQVTVAVIEDHQQAGTAQPVGEHHPAAMHGTDLGAGTGADQYAVPRFERRRRVECRSGRRDVRPPARAVYLWPGRTARQSCHRRWIPAGRSARNCRWAGLLLLLLTLAFGKQFALTSLLGLACLTGQRLFDGLEHPLELRLFLAASLQPLLSAGQVAVQQCQCLLALARTSAS